jgi:peptide/nickel transport system ATP-binding protein
VNQLLCASDLCVRYPAPRTELWKTHEESITAIRNVSIAIDAHSIVGIVGESGAGKTTLAKVLAGLIKPTRGTVRYRDSEIGYPRARDLRRAIQVVFQDPGSSLNPALTQRRVLNELLRFHELVPREGIQERCRELIELVHLPQRVLDAKPRELSGGERQRMAIARALAVAPEVLIADEAVSALDLSVQAAILSLFAELRDRLGLAILLISHDLTVVGAMCERVAVMRAGEIVESGETQNVLSTPEHEYTRALLRVFPTL